MEILCDAVNLATPQVIKLRTVSKIKRNRKKILDVDFKGDNTSFKKDIYLKGCVL